MHIRPLFSQALAFLYYTEPIKIMKTMKFCRQPIFAGDANFVIRIVCVYCSLYAQTAYVHLTILVKCRHTLIGKQVS